MLSYIHFVLFSEAIVHQTLPPALGIHFKDTAYN